MLLRCHYPSIIGISLLLIVHRVAWSEDAVTPNAPVQLAPGLVVDAAKREVRMDATVCLASGILEYVICRPGTFEHESIFTTTCKPSLLHAALLLAGLVPFPLTEISDWVEEAREQPASRVAITVEHQEGGAKYNRRLSELLVNREQKDGVVADRWVFAGSFFHQVGGKNRYAADRTGATISLIPEGAAVIQYGEKAEIPYQGDDMGFEINADTTPSVGTKVQIVFRPHAEKGVKDGSPEGEEEKEEAKTKAKTKTKAKEDEEDEETPPAVEP